MLKKRITIIERARKSVFLRNIGKMMTGTGLAHVVGLAVIPIITRLYTPDQIGLYASYLSLIAIIQSFGSLRYEYATLIPGNQIAANNITALAVFLALVTSSLVFIILLAAGNPVLEWLNLSALGSQVYLLPVSIFSFAAIAILAMSHNRVKQYGNIAKGKVLASTGTGLGQVLLGGLTLSTIGLVSGKVAGDLIATFYLFLKRIRYFENPFQGVTINRMRVMAVRFRYFPYWNAPEAFSAAVSANIPTLVLIAFFTEAIAGFYAIAVKVLFAPIQVVAMAVYQVFSQRIAEKFSRREKLTTFLRNSVLLFAGIGLIPFIALYFVSPQLFVWLLGPEYVETGKYIQILIPFFFASFLVTPFNYIPLMLNRQRTHFFIGLLYLILRLKSMVIGIWKQDVILLLGLYSFVGVLMSTVMLIWIWKLASSAEKYIPVSNVGGKVGTDD